MRAGDLHNETFITSAFSHQATTDASIGSIIDCIVKEKQEDKIIIETNNNVGVIPLIHLHEDITMAKLAMNRIDIGSSVRALILERTEGVFTLTCKKTLIAHRNEIPKSSAVMFPDNKYYGYVKAHTKEGAIISFYNNARGISYGVFPPIGSTVYVTVLKNDSVPLLKMVSSMSLEHDFIYSYMSSFNELELQYSFGGVLNIDSEPISSDADATIYKLKDDWIFVSFFEDQLFDTPLGTHKIGFIDYEKRTIYGACNGYDVQPCHLSYRARVVSLTETFILLRYKSNIFICRRPYYNLNIGDYVYVSLKPNITEYSITIASKPLNLLPFYAAVVEDVTTLQATTNITCTIQCFFNEWCICSYLMEYVLVHITQMTENVLHGSILSGKMYRTKTYNFLVIDDTIPIIYENCSITQNVRCVLDKEFGRSRDRSITLSPFIHGFIKGLGGRDITPFSCYNCQISKITETNVICKFKPENVQITIDTIIPGLGYFVRLPDNRRMRLDLSDTEMKTVKTGDVMDAFIISNTHVSTMSAEITPRMLPGIGDIVNGWVYYYDDNYAYIHINRSQNAQIPCEYYTDAYTSPDVINTIDTFIGKRVKGLLIRNDEHLIMSSRETEYNHSKRLYPRKGLFYRALILSVNGYTVDIYIDVLGVQTTISNNSKSILEPEQYIYVRYISPQDGFEITNVESRIHFSLDPSIHNEETYSKIKEYLNMSDQKKDIPQNDLNSPDNDIEQLDPEREKHSGNITDNDNQSADQYFYNGLEDSFSDDVLIQKHDDANCFASESDDLDEKDAIHHQPVFLGTNRPVGLTYNKVSDPEIQKLKSVYIQRHVGVANIHPKNVDTLIRYFRSKEKLDNINAIAKRVKLAPDTVKSWFEKSKHDPNWSPLIQGRIATRKAMMDILEGGIIWHIYTKFLRLGYQFNDQMCRSVALAFWNKYPEYRLVTKFTASYRWIKRFKLRYGLVNRRVHYHRRSECSKNIAKMYHDKLIEIYKDHETNGTLHCLINIDETSWHINQHRDITWAKVGAEHVEFAGTFGEKDAITAIAAISADPKRFKLPLCIIKNGVTNQAKRILSSVAHYLQIEVSQSGWSTIQCLGNYLTWLRIELNERYKDIEGFTPETRIDLILDQYTSHKNIQIKKLAELLHFKLHFIPSGLTDSFQPLDRYVFGALKAASRAEWYKRYAINPEKGCDIVDACLILLKCWSNLSSATCKKAWDPYSNPEACELDSLVRTKNIELDIEASTLDIDNVVLNDDPMYRAFRGKENLRDTGENDWKYELFRVYPDLKIPNKAHIDEVCTYEGLKQSSNDPYLIKPIEKNDHNLFINVIIQLLGSIPGIYEQILRISKTNDHFNTINSVARCMKLYNEATYDGCKNKIIRQFNENICDELGTDISETIDIIFKNALTEYGLKLKADNTNVIIVHMIPDENGVDISKSLDEMIHGAMFDLNRVVFFEKSYTLYYDFQEIIEYRGYTLILKAVVATKENRSFHLYTRHMFSNKFSLSYNANIKDADINDVYLDDTCIAMYYVFKNEEENENIGIHEQENVIEEETIKVERNFVTKEATDILNEDIRKLLEDINPHEWNSKTNEAHKRTKNGKEVITIPSVRYFNDEHKTFLEPLTELILPFITPKPERVDDAKLKRLNQRAIALRESKSKIKKDDDEYLQ